MEFRVFLVNMDKYNKAEEKALADGSSIGGLEVKFGGWFDLPIEPSELGKTIYERLGGSSMGGYMITNVECTIDMVEDYLDVNDDIWYVNGSAWKLSKLELNDVELFIVNALLDDGMDLDEALNSYDDFDVYNAENQEDLGKEIAELENISFDYELEEYINWDDFADDYASKIIFYDCKSVVKI